MYKVYGLLLGERDIEAHRLLPDVPGVGPTLKVAYFMWCIKNGDEAVLVDTGMKEKDITSRHLYNVTDPETQLKKIGVDPATVTTIIVSHLHSDHFSAFELYPRATFAVQRKEVEFFTGPIARSTQITKPASDMPEVVRLAYQGRIRYLDGDEQIAPGLRVVLVGGHTPGCQVVIVETKNGQAVLCVDVLDLYANLEHLTVGQPCVDLAANFLAWDRIKLLASSPDLIIPGHDPLIMKNHSPIADGVVEVA